MKEDFEAVVRSNMSRVLAYMRSVTGGSSIAEDLTQECFLAAYRAWDSYTEEGKLTHWLMRICRHTAASYYRKKDHVPILSLDGGENDQGSLMEILTDSSTPEDVVLERELADSLLSAIERLPDRQRDIIRCRFFLDYSVEQTASMLGIPGGTVKSGQSAAIEKLRHQMGAAQKKTKRSSIMECREAQKYLFVYAKGIMKEKVAELEEHLAACPLCRGIAESLRELISHFTYAPEDIITHHLIDFPEISTAYCETTCLIQGADRIQKILDENGGKVPEDATWFGSGSTANCEAVARFDEGGYEMDYDTVREGNFNRYYTKGLKKVASYMHCRETFVNHGDRRSYRKSPDAPMLWVGDMNNDMGSACKSGIFTALPKKATNIRLKRGNGYIPCGEYIFVYSERYLAENEVIKLEYTFNM
ncbi:MAG: sigma-70 family RNA polymerase sigma factor [Clostridia bacterium]|nr:sigma-70 family RNA polymerase sigma factor [Clostridia bacterium]